MKRKIILGAAILVVVGGAILGFILVKSGKAGDIKYRTEPLAKGDIEALVVTSGTINPINIVDVGSQVSGKISKLFVDFNSPVKAGQVVAELDRDLLSAKVDQNQSNYESAMASLDRAKTTLDNLDKKYKRALELYQKNQVSLEEKESAEANFLGAKSDLVTAQARVSQAKSQLDSSKVDLSYSIIRSPIDGVVITRSVNEGQTVAASFQAPVLFKVATDLTKMRVECSVDETDIGKVKEGQSCRFSVSAFPNETFTGVVTQVRYSPETVQNVVTYTTVVNAENPERKLMPGMTATVSIVVGEARGVLRIPNAAMRFTPNLPPDKLEAIMKETGAQMRAQRQAGQAGGVPAQAEGVQGAGGVPAQATGGQAGQGGALNSRVQANLQAIARNRQRQGGVVWVMDDQGKMKPFMVRTGITDNSYSELTRGEIKEGMKVILGEETPSVGGASATRQQGPGGPGRMMFIGR